MYPSDYGWCMCGHKKELHLLRGVLWWKKIECRCSRATAYHIYQAFERKEIPVEVMRVLGNVICGCTKYTPHSNLELLEIRAEEKGL